MKSLLKLTVLMMVLVFMTSCNSKTKPNYQYFPDMYEPVGYEAYGEADFLWQDMTAKLPAEGSVARGHMPFDFDDTNDGYLKAKAELKNPLDSTEIDGPKGGQLYDIYCGVCHGKKGDGQGILVQREKMLGVPAFNDAGRALTEGSIYHTIYYGKNVMGSYKNQLLEEERWQVVDYVMGLKAELGGN